MRKSMLKTGVLLALGVCSVASVALAAPQIDDLHKVVVTANRTQQMLLNTAADVNVITAKQIENGPYQTIAQVLDTVPGVVVQNSGFVGSKSKVLLNGDERVVVLVNGVRVNIAQGIGSGAASVDFQFLPSLQDIARIEVVKGGSSTLYGSDAVGGVINIITKTATTGNHGTVSQSVGSWGMRDTGITYGVRTNDNEAFVSANSFYQGRTVFKDALTGTEQTWPNSYKLKNTANVNLAHQINDNNRIGFIMTHAHVKEGGPYNFSSAIGNREAYYEYDQTNFSVKYDWMTKSDHDGFLRFYKNNYKGEFVNYLKHSNDGTYGSHTTGLEFQQSVALSDRDSLMVGGDIHKSTMYASARYANGLSINNSSLFVQNTLDLNHDFTVVNGLRHTHNSQYGNKWTTSASINKRIGKEAHAYVAYNQVFNAPNGDAIAAMLSGNDALKKAGYPANLDLKATTGYTWTIGYGADLTKNTSYTVNAFYNNIRNSISWKASPVPGTKDWYPYNIGIAKEKGLNLELKHIIDAHWNTTLSYTRLEVKENSAYNPAGPLSINGQIYPNMYRLSLAYANANFNGNLVGRYATGASATQYYRPSYLVFDLNLTYAVEKNFDLYLNIYNLTNRAYAMSGGIYAEYIQDPSNPTKYILSNNPLNGTNNYPAPGRQFVVGATYKF